MEKKTNHVWLYLFGVLLAFSACQNETTDVDTPEEQEMIQPNTTLARSMSNVTANYGGYDDILDGASW